MVLQGQGNRVARLTCPFTFSYLHNVLDIYSISWERGVTDTVPADTGAGMRWIGVESDPNMNNNYSVVYSNNSSSLLVPLSTGDVEETLVFRCVMQLTRCNDSENQLCHVKNVPGPSMLISGNLRNFCPSL